MSHRRQRSTSASCRRAPRGLSLVVTASLLALALVPLMLASGAGATDEPSVPVVTQPEPPATTVPDTDEAEGTPAEVPSAPAEVPSNVVPETPAESPAPESDLEVEAVNPGTIVVHKAGLRDGVTNDSLPLEGALFGAYDDDDLEPGDLVAQCAVRTDAAGECTIGGLAPDTYYVAEIDDPVAPSTDFKRIAALNVDGGSSTDLYYDQVNLGPGETEHTRVFADRHVNPEFPAVCGVDVTLFDLSSSISDSELADMQSAAQGFVGALTGTPSSVGVYSFATSAPAAGNSNLQLTSVTDASGATTLDAAIDALAQPGGEAQYTNWDAAFRSIVSGGGNPDAVIVLTDGDPTVYGVPAEGPVETEFAQIENGVFSANNVKAAGARVIAVGIGGPSVLNLQAISGPVENSDWFDSDFDVLDQTLAEIALEACGGSVTVHKSIDTGDGIVDGVGWTFHASPDATPASGVTDADGLVAFDFANLPDQGDAQVTISEDVQAGYSLESVECTDSHDNPVPVTPNGANGFDLGLAKLDIVTCDVVNLASSSLSIVKTGPATALAGTEISYDITVTNHGPGATAEPVEVTDDLPADTSFVSAEGDGWTCVEADGVVTCTSDGPLGAGEHVITVVVSTDPAFAGGALENCATVTAGDTPEIEAADVGPSCVTTQVDPSVSPDVVVNPPVEEAPVVAEPAAAGALAFTGSSDSVPLAAIGIALLGLGAAFVLLGRNRKASKA